MEDVSPAGLPPAPTEDQLPYDDEVPVDSSKHDLAAHLCREVLDLYLRHRDDYYIGVNLGLYYSTLQDNQNPFRAPDLMIVLDTDRRRLRKSWIIWQEGGQGPDVIVEMISESTAAVDRGEKKRIYAKLVKVPEYFLYDPDTGALEGYRLDPSLMEYQPIPADGSGRFRSSRLGLLLGNWEGAHRGYTGPWLRFFAPDQQMLPTEEEARHCLAGRLAAYEKKFGPLPA